MVPSDLLKIPEGIEREKAYRQAVADHSICQDSLDTRLSARVGLSESEAASLLDLVSRGCRANTKLCLRHSIACIPCIRGYGIFRRVLFINGQASYCAGQSYPDEIREVRKCLL